MGAVVVFTTSLSKGEATKHLGANNVIPSKDEAQRNQYAGKVHFLYSKV